MTRTNSRRPQGAVPRPYHFPRFERQRLVNGVEVITVSVRKVPLVSIVALIDAGGARDPAGREGLSVLTSQLLMEGTATQEGSVLTEAFEQLGGSVDIAPDWDSVALRLTVLADRLQPALRLLSEVLRTPGFRERDVARLKAERNAELLQISADPRKLADQWFARVLYTKASRYTRPLGGDGDSVRAITGTDVRAFHHSYYGPRRMTIVVAGDVDSPSVISAVRSVLEEWSGNQVEAGGVEDDAADEGRQIYIIPKARAPQSELRIGHRGVPRGHPDYFALVVMNAVLGGLFSSRINLNLREAHGYTYGAHSMFDWRRSAGPFVISTAVESGVTGAATHEVISELERMQGGPINPEELTLATSYLGGVFPIRYETTTAIANALAAMVTYRLPEDYFDTYRARIEGVTPRDILRVAREHLHLEQLVIVAVGDAEQIKGPLATSVGLTPVVVGDGNSTGGNS